MLLKGILGCFNGLHCPNSIVWLVIIACDKVDQTQCLPQTCTCHFSVVSSRTEKERQLGSHYTSAMVLSSRLGLLWEEVTLQFIQANNRIQFLMTVKLKAATCLLAVSQGHLLDGKGHSGSPHFSRKNLSHTESLCESPTNWQMLSVDQVLQSLTLISSTLTTSCCRTSAISMKSL